MSSVATPFPAPKEGQKKMIALSATIKDLNLEAVTKFLEDHEQPFEQCAPTAPACTSAVHYSLTPCTDLTHSAYAPSLSARL